MSVKTTALCIVCGAFLALTLSAQAADDKLRTKFPLTKAIEVKEANSAKLPDNPGAANAETRVKANRQSWEDRHGPGAGSTLMRETSATQRPQRVERPQRPERPEVAAQRAARPEVVERPGNSGARPDTPGARPGNGGDRPGNNGNGRPGNAYGHTK